MKRRLLLFGAIAVVAIAAVVVLVVVNRDGTPSAADNRCPHLIVFFKTDDQMHAASGKLMADTRVTDLRQETKAEAFKRFQEIFKDQPELLQITRPEALPADVQFGLAKGVDKNAMLSEIRTNYPVDRADDLCDVGPAPRTR